MMKIIVKLILLLLVFLVLFFTPLQGKTQDPMLTDRTNTVLNHSHISILSCSAFTGY